MGIELTILVLLILGLAFMVLEAIVPTFGLLGIGGAASFLAALFMLRHESEFYGMPVDVPMLLALGIVGLAVLLGSFYFIYIARTKKISAGAEIMPGMAAIVIDWSGTSGRVRTDGEIWAAQGPAGLNAGDSVIIAERNNLILTVTKGV
jgi:membrane-bound serine protease (ClpP class)